MLTIRVRDGETVGGVEGRGRRATDGTATGQDLGVWHLCTCDGGGGGGERRRGNTSLQPSLLCAAGLINAPDNEI